VSVLFGIVLDLCLALYWNAHQEGLVALASTIFEIDLLLTIFLLACFSFVCSHLRFLFPLFQSELTFYEKANIFYAAAYSLFGLSCLLKSRVSKKSSVPGLDVPK
jgi:hypothetical protein